jgi:polysaccharide chain length determinant protein (PEP-CTERM system associated)
MEDTHVHALDYLSVFRRRKYWLLAPIAASIVVGAILVKVLPKEYRSTATLAVAAPVVSPTLINQTTMLDNQERLRALQQQLVSPPILARVMKEEGLGDGSIDDGKAMRLRHSITIEVPPPVAITNEARRLDTFTVSYGDPDPARAQRLTDRLVHVFVDENSKTRAERAEDTSAFISSQLRESQGRLDNLEAQLRRAKESHIGRLPEQMQANLSIASGLRQQFEASTTALRGEQDRLSMIERQIDSMEKGNPEIVIVSRGGSGDSVQASAPETRVLMLQRELAAARQMYTDKHPEVQRLQEELAAAKGEAAADKDRPASDRKAQLQQDPAYRQLIVDRSAAQQRIRDLQRAEADMRRQISQYDARVEATPMVEQQLSSVQRDYDLEKTQYSDLTAKLRTAAISENVERNRRGEQFTVLYGASYPTEPTKPIPWQVMLMTVMAGVCLGGAATFGREYLDRSVHNVRDLRDEFDVPVLGEVTRIQPA